MTKTLFRTIIAREIPAKIEHEDARCIVIHDIQPQAPVHLLIIPKKPIPRLAEAVASGRGRSSATSCSSPGEIAAKLKLERGFRLVSTAGPTPARACPTCTCTCWRSARWAGRRARPPAVGAAQAARGPPPATGAGRRPPRYWSSCSTSSTRVRSVAPSRMSWLAPAARRQVDPPGHREEQPALLARELGGGHRARPAGRSRRRPRPRRSRR